MLFHKDDQLKKVTLSDWIMEELKLNTKMIFLFWKVGHSQNNKNVFCIVFLSYYKKKDECNVGCTYSITDYLKDLLTPTVKYFWKWDCDNILKSFLYFLVSVTGTAIP